MRCLIKYELRGRLTWQKSPAEKHPRREFYTDHQLPGVHYVRQVPNYQVYNLTFLAIGGAGFILSGWALTRAGKGEAGH